MFLPDAISSSLGPTACEAICHIDRLRRLRYQRKSAKVRELARKSGVRRRDLSMPRVAALTRADCGSKTLGRRGHRGTLKAASIQRLVTESLDW